MRPKPPDSPREPAAPPAYPDFPPARSLEDLASPVKADPVATPVWTGPFALIDEFFETKDGMRGLDIWEGPIIPDDEEVAVAVVKGKSDETLAELLDLPAKAPPEFKLWHESDWGLTIGWLLTAWVQESVAAIDRVLAAYPTSPHRKALTQALIYGDTHGRATPEQRARLLEIVETFPFRADEVNGVVLALDNAVGPEALPAVHRLLERIDLTPEQKEFALGLRFYMKREELEARRESARRDPPEAAEENR